MLVNAFSDYKKTLNGRSIIKLRSNNVLNGYHMIAMTESLWLDSFRQSHENNDTMVIKIRLNLSAFNAGTIIMHAPNWTEM